MILYLSEYTEFCKRNINPNYFKILHYYDNMDLYLHEMPAEYIIKEMNRNGSRSFYIQKAAINKYLKWLHSEYNIDTSNLYFELNKKVESSETFEFIGFYDFNDMQTAIKDAEYTIETLYDNFDRDLNGLYAIFYLEWLGVLPESALSIKLEDVTDMGKKVYVPSENRTIEVNNDIISSYFWLYKNMTGRKKNSKSKHETPYSQNTFYRTIQGDDVNMKKIYNIKQIFIKACGDERFSKKYIYYSGRYYEMYQYEINNNISLESFNSESKKVITEIFNIKNVSDFVISSIIRDYRTYKKGYIERL